MIRLWLSPAGVAGRSSWFSAVNTDRIAMHSTGRLLAGCQEPGQIIQGHGMLGIDSPSESVTSFSICLDWPSNASSNHA
jgi:hypothetical protein